MSFFAQLIEAQRNRKMKPIEKINPHHQTDILQQKCNRLAGCGKPITVFRDELSKKEYGISGLCQQCQDELFGV